MFTLIIGFIILVYSVILHEIAHGFVADRLGDPTARMRGRLTLNPIPHIDPVMSVLIPFMLYFFGSPVIFGAAKPVPIDPYNFREGRRDMGLVGLAGPATNLLLAVFAGLLFHLIFLLPFSPFLFAVLPILKIMAFYNLALAALNLIPIPPLDGSRILAAISPKEVAAFLDSMESYGFFILIFLLFFPFGGGFSLGSIIFNLVSFWMKLLGFATL